MKRAWPLVKREGGGWVWAVIGSKGERYEQDERLERIMTTDPRIAELERQLEEATDAANHYENIVGMLVLAFDCPNPSAMVEHIQALFEQRERNLLDYENWIVAAEPFVSFGLPASYGAWRRPEGQ